TPCSRAENPGSNAGVLVCAGKGSGVASPARLELATLGLGNRCSIRLSYGDPSRNGDGDSTGLGGSRLERAVVVMKRAAGQTAFAAAAIETSPSNAGQNSIRSFATDT